MAHTKSAKKMIRVLAKQRRLNRATKSAVKTYISKAEELIVAKELEPAQEAVKRASVALDKAAKKGVLHPNNAARHESRLRKKFHAAFLSPSK